jgi:hypothetical protein
MKRILFFLLLLPYFAIAQRELLRDSAWLTRQAMYTTTGTTTTTTYQYFQNTMYVYTNGESDTQVRLLGDSATALNAVTGQQIDYIRDLADKAATVIRKDPIIRQWQEMHNQTTAIGIGSMAAVIQGLFENDLIGDVTVKAGSAAAVPGDIMKAANGNVRLLFGNKGYRIFVFSDTMLRVMGYPATGSETDVYRVAPRVYKDITGEFIIRLKK